ncbi:MAG: hypothetical protein AB7T22_06345 [Calditrichaceae bacterium]
MNAFDQIVLLVTGLTAIYLLFRLFKDYQKTNSMHNIYYILSFTVLLVSGLLLIALGYGILASPLVVIVAVFIPVGLAAGLISEFFPKHEKTFLIFAILGLLAIAVTRFTGPHGLATLVLVIVHTVAGLTIFGLPILVSKKGEAPKEFIWVTVGGTLIGIGGIALAFLKAGVPILSADVIFTILAPILLLMTIAYTFGFVKKMQLTGK